MANWRPPPHAVVLLLGLALGASLSPSLTGCSGGASFDGLFGLFDGDGLPRPAAREADRFEVVYGRYVTRPDDERARRHFRNAFARVREDYVHTVADDRLIDAAIEGIRELEAEPGSVAPAAAVEAALDSMLASLDPHSAYLNPAEYRESQVAIKGKFGGIGIQVTMGEGYVKVISPIEGTPGARADLRPGDLITHLDGGSLENKGLEEAVRLMRGEPGTRIVLTIRRQGVPPFDVPIVREVISVVAVRWRVEGAMGYIRVASFSERVEGGIAQAMREIRQQTGTGLRGLVLDLRSNPGGLLEQSLLLADSFLDEGTIISVRSRHARDTRNYVAERGDLARGLPMVVLIDGGSASASEIVAGALQDHGRAVIMGRRSYGKGSVQTIMPLPVEGALRLTTALYYLPSGRTIQATGVDPDIVFLELPDKDDGKEAKNAAAQGPRREADLPGALPAGAGGRTRVRATLDETRCPVAGEKGREDRQLGCALTYLRAGSTAKFLAALPPGPAL